jgi:hypothetical protein
MSKALEQLIWQRIVRLYHPRRHKWSAHFKWDGTLLVGKTVIGRATVAVLEINHSDAIAVRDALCAEGVFPWGTGRPQRGKRRK